MEGRGGCEATLSQRPAFSTPRPAPVPSSAVWVMGGHSGTLLLPAFIDERLEALFLKKVKNFKKHFLHEFTVKAARMPAGLLSVSVLHR